MIKDKELFLKLTKELNDLVKKVSDLKDNSKSINKHNFGFPPFTSMFFLFKITYLTINSGSVLLSFIYILDKE